MRKLRIVSMLSLLLVSLSTLTMAQTKPAPAKPTSTKPAPTKSVEDEKFVFLNNGVTIGMIVKSVLKADTKRLKLTGQQIPRAKQIITDATVNYNEGVKKLKASGMSQKKLRVLAIDVEKEKARQYQTILTKEQYAALAANHNRMYPEGKL